MFFFSWKVTFSVHSCHVCNENPIYVFPVKELHGLRPNFHILVSVSDLYMYSQVHIFSCSRTGRPIVGIYKSLSQTHECGNWDRGRPIPFLGIFVSNFRYCVFAVQKWLVSQFFIEVNYCTCSVCFRFHCAWAVFFACGEKVKNIGKNRLFRRVVFQPHFANVQGFHLRWSSKIAFAQLFM